MKKCISKFISDLKARGDIKLTGGQVPKSQCKFEQGQGDRYIVPVPGGQIIRGQGTCPPVLIAMRYGFGV
jgi:hypothetical protein